MKKMLMLLSTCKITLGIGTSVICNTFISCRNPKSKKTEDTSEEDDGNYEYGILDETKEFSKDDFDKYVDSSLIPITSLLHKKFLDQSADHNNFDFITVLNSLRNKKDPCNSLIWNKQSVSAENYCVDAFLDDWTSSELEQKDIDLIKSLFVSKKNTSKKQRTQSQLNILKLIKEHKNLVKDKFKNIKSFILHFNNDVFKQKDINSYILKFLKSKPFTKVSSLLLNVKPRFEQIFNNFVNATAFDDAKDLTNVNGQNLISYIKKPENIKMMNDNFNSKTNDDKVLMMFMIKFNYMYKYMSASDANPENGQFLFEALFKDINMMDIADFNLVKDIQSSTICKKFIENGQKIYENFANYFKDIFENGNSEKSLEPFYCLVEGIMNITKQKVFKTKIDESIKNTEIKLETIFECICEFMTVIKGSKNNNELKYFNIKDGKTFMEDLILKSSLLEGIFIENESINKATVLGSAGIAAGVAAYLFGGLGMAASFPVGLVAGGLAWWYSKADNTSSVPININANLKDCCKDLLWWKAIANYFISDETINIAKYIDIEDWMQNLLKEYCENQEYQEYIQAFGNVKDILSDKNNNFLKELQDFIDQGGFKSIVTDFFSLINKIESVGDDLKDQAKKQEISSAIDTLFQSIGIDRQKSGEDTIVTGSVLKNLINWINNPDSSIDKTFDSIVNLLEQKCNHWNDNNFENNVNNLAKIIEDKKDIEIEYISFETIKNSNNSNLNIKLNYKLKILATNDIYNIEFKNKNFKKLPRNFKISKFEKIL